MSKFNPQLSERSVLPPDIAKQASQLAEDLLTKAKAARTRNERAHAAKMTRLLADSEGKEFTFHLADQIFRPHTPKEQARVFRRLVQSYGTPDYLNLYERSALRLGAFASRFFPSMVMPLVSAQIRNDSRDVILTSDTNPVFPEHTNVNLLGEAILGEEEAEKRLEENLKLLAEPHCNYLSLKISSIFSQINLLDEERTIAKIQERLRALYRTGKFINLDMEDYRDLHLTINVFRRTLSEPEFQDLEAGIVLQAYLPESFTLLQELTTWAKSRPAPIKVRLVKGANLAMEKVEASVHGWAQAPYTTKLEVDANYKRMLNFACLPENAETVKVGVASHNLFEIAYALLLRRYHQVEDHVELEMLQGMANDQARILAPDHAPVRFYTPLVRPADFHSAIAYLVRRLDENTSPENFLCHLFSMNVGDASWQDQEKRFFESYQAISTLDHTPRRERPIDQSSPSPEKFTNSPDTDWNLKKNRTWLQNALNNTSEKPLLPLTSLEELDGILETATSSSWSKTTQQERAEILRKAAQELAKARGELIAIMREEASKRPAEADIEVSEAIDFANYYAHRSIDSAYLDGTSARPLGPILVTPPWNFPCAIPCGGVLAALVAGNPVILKPAPETISTAWVMAQCLWKAGIPKHALQFIPCSEHQIGEALVRSPEIRGIILTGSSETGQLFQRWRPDIPLFAETSGKNALVISSAADPDLAIKDLVQSAFSHAGQKCSAASICLLHADLYDSPSFMRQLRDAAASLPVGPASEPSSYVTPLISEPSPDLIRGLTELDAGESWLLEPRQLTPTLWSPGIRIGVQADSWIHRTELFGPVLSVIRVKDLSQAIAIQNSSDFGLTGGLHSLDPAEITRWRNEIEVGNAYLNRPITGAIVGRQPFGGWKKSSVGPGAKAGGPNYLTQFCHWENDGKPTRLAPPRSDVSTLVDELGGGEMLEIAAQSYAYWWEHEFSQEQDLSDLHGERNQFRYRPAPEIVAPELSGEALALAKIAAASVGTRLVESSSHPLHKKLSTPPILNGRLELLRYLHEQSISTTTHRHGRVSQ